MSYMSEAFAQLENANSISDLCALINQFDATAPWIDNPLGMILQLYAGKSAAGW